MIRAPWLLFALLAANAFAEDAAPLTASSPYPCKTADPNKVSVFVQLNPGAVEVKGAAEAACQRGETFLLVPPQTKEEIEKLDQDFYRCRRKCDDRKMRAITGQNEAVGKRFPLNDTHALEGFLEKLAQDHKTLASFSISGHHIQDFYGEYAQPGISTAEYMKMWRSLHEKHPEFLGRFERMAALGCYTATPEWMSFITDVFPQRPFAYGGYYASGPLGNKPAAGAATASLAHDFDAIIRGQSEAEVCRRLARLKNYSELNVGLFVRTCSGLEVVRQQDPGEGLPTTCLTVGEGQNACPADAPARATALAAELEKYWSGERPIPKDTQGGKLRALYSEQRQLEGCAPALARAPESNLLLVFFQNVPDNFAAVFYPAINAVADKLKAMGIKENDRLWVPRVKGPHAARADYLALVKNLANYPNAPPEFTHLAQLLQNYVVDLSPACVDADVWHELSTGDHHQVTAQDLREATHCGD